MNRTRKALPKTAFDRIYWIDRKIAAGGYPRVPTLAHDYAHYAGYASISEATINRDIDFMRCRLGAPIEYDYTRKGYYYSDAAFRLPLANGFTSADSLLALGMAKNLLNLYKDTPLYEAASQVVDTITTPLAGNGGKGGEKNAWWEDRIVVPSPASAPIDGVIWDALISGLRENRVVTFDYRGAWDESFCHRRVHPWQLLFDNGVWLLSGWAVERSGHRLFFLSRMKNVIVTQETFILPAKYDYSQHNDTSYFGVFDNANVQRYRIALHGPAMTFATERKWAADQEFEADEDCVIMTFSSNQHDKVLEWLLARGMWACPLEPTDLVAEWKENLREMRNLGKYWEV
jgi:predicted DNA-binding transcriptional regulator YafY